MCIYVYCVLCIVKCIVKTWKYSQNNIVKFIVDRQPLLFLSNVL